MSIRHHQSGNFFIMCAGFYRFQNKFRGRPRVYKKKSAIIAPDGAKAALICPRPIICRTTIWTININQFNNHVNYSKFYHLILPILFSHLMQQ